MSKGDALPHLPSSPHPHPTFLIHLLRNQRFQHKYLVTQKAPEVRSVVWQARSALRSQCLSFSSILCYCLYWLIFHIYIFFCNYLFCLLICLFVYVQISSPIGSFLFLLIYLFIPSIFPIFHTFILMECPSAELAIKVDSRHPS